MTLEIELTVPQRINGKRVSFQSLWLLLRLFYARRYEDDIGIVRLTELRRQFTDARTLCMFVSRAFRAFAEWEILVGWGEDAQADPRFLNLEKRSQGPFWLLAGEETKICCFANGRAATHDDLLRSGLLARAGRCSTATA